ncbi:lipopolysaccharide biosynthesis protein [Pelagibacterium luteolum]|uniref:Membrane protein involved in the export of O-antigen and teichoic acid n=1 Tax=Pelagibacterium luteolum TaxID=440168 RepID=A0A1G7UG21_9HYPH|nr:lipopolysaccharide biosynthesis protein [Pelagibacterium luteolum]SDG46407.1 Membrane protein involved in the export of O-antigen and teichoic acid [Pelagibacterium luteolum]
MSIAGKLASKSVLIFGLRIFGAGFIFLVQAAISRVWGAESLGDFLLVIAAANLIGVALPLGFQTVATYFAAEYGSRGEGNHLRRFVRRSYVYLAVMGVVALVLGWPLTHLMGEAGEHLRPLWLQTVVIGVATGLTYVSTTILVGLKQPMTGYLPDMLFRPGLTLLAFGLVAVLSTAPDMARMLWVLAVALLVLFAWQCLSVRKAVLAVPTQDAWRAKEPRRWWRFAAPWVLVTLASDYFFDINLILLAGLLGREDLAIFGVSTRIFALAAFGVVAVYALTLPNMFDAERDPDQQAFAKRVGEANLVATGLAVLLFLGVLIFGRYVLMIFGEDFADGALPVAILCLGLVVRAAFGPASLVLSMHDRPWASLPAVGLGVMALVIGNWTLVPPYGLMGAAVSAFIAVSIWSVTLWLTALHRAKVDVSIFGLLRRRPVAA